MSKGYDMTCNKQHRKINFRMCKDIDKIPDKEF